MTEHERRRRWIARSIVGTLALVSLVLPASAHDSGRVLPAVGPTPEPTLQVPVVARADVANPGATFVAPPQDVAAPRTTPPTTREIQAHMQAGDSERALQAAREFVQANPWGRERDAAWLLIGMIERERGRHNAASEAFTRVRAADGPLGPWGTYYEAEQDLVRGKPWVALKECEAYRARWPDGVHAQDCLRVTARAWASLGRSVSALAAAEEYDAAHEDAPLTEQIELQLAEWEARNDPEAAIARLRRLATEHTAPLTGRYAEELLAQLRAQGFEDAIVPDDTWSLQRRAISMRDAGRRDAAWEAWEELTRRAQDDPALQRWLDAQAPVFGWRTRHWDFLAERFREDYDAHPTGDGAWEVYRTLDRGARFTEAADFGLVAIDKHGTTRRWKYAQDELGYTLMLAGRYGEAVTQFDAVAARGGWVGRKGAWEAAFAAYMSDDLDDALARFDAILEKNRSYLVEAHYWRSRALARLGRADEAEADRWWVLEHEPDSWYTVMVEQGGEAEPAHPFGRDGRWPGPALPDLRLYAPSTPPAPPVVPVAQQAESRPLHANSAFGALTWPMRVKQVEGTPAPPPLVLQDLWAPPPSYRSGAFFDPEDATDDLAAFAREYGEAWPTLPAIADLASVGLYDLTGPAFAEFYDDWERAVRYRSHPQHLTARSMRMRQEDWRPLFLVTRDHHHTARFTYGLHETVDDREDREQAQELAWPLAHARYVWAHSREQDVDPYLVLGLMRQESVYASTATSRVGARGAMQIMPRTGHLLADLSHDTTFTAGDLEDPVVAVGYGLQYLGLLMDRFDGVYPLAVASYNGGPHNVSTWLEGTSPEMPMDAWVEHIPFRETRNYVKKVSANYATYLDLYAPDGTTVVMPEHPRGDDSSIVDF